MAGSWRPVRRLLGTAAAIAFVSGFLTGSAMAQSNSGRAVFSTGADFSHACFFRGIRRERSGLIARPYMDTTSSLFEGTKGLNSVTFTIGRGPGGRHLRLQHRVLGDGVLRKSEVRS